MELQHVSHTHPLLFREDRSNFYCSGCDQREVLGPCFSCADCEFYLHKKCAEAPMQIDDHPFHRYHTLILGTKDSFCFLCLLGGKGFMYYCSSCKFSLHVNCALLPRDTAGKFIGTLHFAHPHPLILLANDNNHLQHRRLCFGCVDPKADAYYACFDCFFFLHKKCVELPTEISHPYHRKHQLILELCEDNRVCNLCETEHEGLFYRCSLCDVGIHSKCAFPPPIIKDTSHHEHPFTLLLRPKSSYTCDACDTQGSNVSYICSTCNIQVHQKCISLPRIIAFNLHHHPLYYNLFLCLPKHDSRTWDCQLCFKKVNLEHGSYYCSKPDCNFVVHVNCAIRKRDWLGIIEFKNQGEAEKHFEKLESLYNKYGDCIINKINVGEDGIAAEIEHISHGHNLMFSKETKDKKYCNGCVLPILSSFYYCSKCDFFLHEACAELPSKRLLWFEASPLTILTNCIFRCYKCKEVCSGFSYKLDGRPFCLCLRCAAFRYSFTYDTHEPLHLFYDIEHESHCNACGIDCRAMYRSKDGDFALDKRCLALPRTVWHKCDEHSLILACQADSDYPLQHYCDICEERRDPKYWFYHCKDCNTVVHPKCALGEYSFIKLGTNYTCKKHPHPLTFVQKMYYYPNCDVCGKPCEDLSLECAEHICNYIAHLKCITLR